MNDVIATRPPPALAVTDLAGKAGLVIGIANGHSIATGCARAFAGAGTTLAATYLNKKAKPFVTPVTDARNCTIILSCDVQEAGAMEALFAAVKCKWGRLDFLLNSIAFAPRNDPYGRVTDCSAAGFAMAMDVSCHS
jgi:enoyl-[acyl-carrier protein] reductase I